MVQNDPDAMAQINDTLVSIGAKISAAVSNAIDEAITGVDATVAERAGRSLVTAFTSLARFSEEVAMNTTRFRQGMLSSKAVTEQITELEEKKLQLERYRQQAVLAGIAYNQEDYQTSLRMLEAQEQILATDKASAELLEEKLGTALTFVKGLKGIPGLSGILDASKLEADIKAAATEVDEFGNVTIKKLKGLDKALIIAGSSAKQLAGNLLGPATLMAALVKGFLDVDKAATSFQQSTGQTARNTDLMNGRLASSVDYYESLTAITKDLGRNANNVINPETVAAAAELKNLMGVTAEDAGQLAVMAQVTGQDFDALVKSSIDVASNFNRTNRTAINQKQILEGVAKTSLGIKATFGTNTKALQESVAQAKRLGLELSDVENIASKLLDFESSIEAELEAQLLTGRDINLSKARELALNNELAGLGEEIFKHSVDIHDYGNMTRIQQEAQAAMLGLTRDQLGRIAYLRAIDEGMTADQAAAAADVNAEEMKRMSVQESLQKSIAKMAEAFAPTLEALVPIVELLSTMIKYASYLAIPFTALSTIIQQISDGLGVGKNVVTDTLKVVASLASMYLLVATYQAMSAVASASRLALARREASVSVASTLATVIKSSALAGPLGIALGVATAAGIGAMLYGAINKGNDVVSPGYGSRMLMGPEGAVALNDKDTVIAGTELFPSAPQGTTQSMPVINMEPVVSEIRAMKEQMATLLGRLVEKDTSISLNADKVNQGLALGAVGL
jgi:hypothetical protein